MEQEQLLKQLERELRVYSTVLGEAADTIINQEVSDYPIFVVSKNDVQVGITLVEQEKVKGEWSINASTLEEFVAKQIIKEENVERFKKIYKDPQAHLCLFVLSELGANFIFLPRK